MYHFRLAVAYGEGRRFDVSGAFPAADEPAMREVLAAMTQGLERAGYDFEAEVSRMTWEPL